MLTTGHADAPEQVDELDSSDRDRFGWRIWWVSDDINWWVTQAPYGAGSDKPRTVEDLHTRGPFTASPRQISD